MRSHFLHVRLEVEDGLLSELFALFVLALEELGEVLTCELFDRLKIDDENAERLIRLR